MCVFPLVEELAPETPQRGSESVRAAITGIALSHHRARLGPLSEEGNRSVLLQLQSLDSELSSKLRNFDSF